MGMLRAIGGAVGGTLADQWKDVITAGRFDEHSAVVPGVLKDEDNGRGSNGRGSEGVITNGSKIYVPENTAAFIFNQSGIENIISQPGGYEYHDGQESIFNGDGVKKSIFKQIGERIGYGGITSDYNGSAFRFALNQCSICSGKFHDIFRCQVITCFAANGASYAGYGFY